jgi:hypothetical protein
MDVNPMDAVESAKEQAVATNDRRIARLNTWVALTVAILATFMAVCKVKDDNIVQAMQQAQADKIDHWGYYQARNLREELAKATLAQLTLGAADRPAAQQAAYATAIANYAALAKEQADKKQAVMSQAPVRLVGRTACHCYLAARADRPDPQAMVVLAGPAADIRWCPDGACRSARLGHAS